MSGLYDLNPAPHQLDVVCPDCGGHGVFEFGKVVEIPLKKDIPFFQNSDLFEYRSFKEPLVQKWHGAIYHAILHGGSTAAIRDLPEGYTPEDWAHDQWFTRYHRTDLGAVVCSACGYRKRTMLNWPEDAFYSVTVKGEQLWAFNRESLVELRDYLQSTDRKVTDYRWSFFLLHVPETFKRRKVRDEVVKRINKLLKAA